VLGALGAGFNTLSRRAAGEASDVLNAFGIIAIALGIGLILSALVAYLISRKAGLLSSSPAEERP
jgi:hypothetical protein